MKDHELNRLLRAASKARPSASPDAAPSIPFGFETRVLAHWTQASEFARFALFRRALAAACAVALATVLIGYRSLETSPSPELALANYSLESGESL